MRSWPSLAVGAFALACNRAPESSALRSDTAHGDVASERPVLVSYTTVDSIFRVHCVSCHSGSAAARDVDLSSYEGVMRGREGIGPIVTVGNPASSPLIEAVRETSAMKRTSSAHVGAFPSADLAAMASWISAGAQPTGTDEERLRATLRLYVVALAHAQRGFYALRRHYSASFDSLRIIPVAGVEISFLQADTARWEARISHARLRERCVVSGSAAAGTAPLQFSDAATFCGLTP
jgi:hypothetical protein